MADLGRPAERTRPPPAAASGLVRPRSDPRIAAGRWPAGPRQSVSPEPGRCERGSPDPAPNRRRAQIRETCGRRFRRSRATCTESQATDLLDALAELDTYSLVTRSRQSPTFTVHRLVQDVTRRSLRDDTEHRALTEALRWVNDAFVGDPEDVRTWPTLDPLAPHARAAARHADRAGIADPTARLMSQLGMLLTTKAQHAEAEPLMRRALAIDEQSFGTEHPNVAIRLNNLAAVAPGHQPAGRGRAADAPGAGHRREELRARTTPTSPSTSNNLAQLLQATNRLAEAEPLMRRALAIDEQSYGTEHPERRHRPEQPGRVAPGTPTGWPRPSR